MKQPATEREFELPGLRLAAREWGRAGQHPVLALHGWLDNAGSFDLLAPRLEACHVLAIDAAGHGRSGNRSPDATYNIWQEVGDVIEVTEQMSWPRFTLLGHSRGAAIATLLAGTYPERIDKIVLIEGAIPILGEAESSPENLAQSLNERRELSRKSGRIFADRGAALEERVKGFSPVAYETAEVLARRSLRAVPGGYQWHADQRLKATSEFKLTAEHAKAFIRRITAPVLLFMAERSPFAASPLFRGMLEFYAALEVVTLPGGHHLHLEGAESEIAARTLAFLGLQSGDGF